MKNKIRKNVISNILFLGFVLGFYPYVLAQNGTQETSVKPSVSQETLKQSVEDAIKKAVKDIEVEQNNKQQILAKELEDKLITAVNEWVFNAKEEKSKELNKLSHRDWADLKKFVSPLPYDYYLRDVTYIVNNSDVVKTDSVITPYKALVVLEERLYIERYHSPDASSIEPYLYTVFTPVTLHFEYRENNFSTAQANYEQVSVESGWLK